MSNHSEVIITNHPWPRIGRMNSPKIHPMAPMGSQSEAMLGAGVKLLVDAESRIDPLPSLRGMIDDLRQLQVRNSPKRNIFEISHHHAVLKSSSTYRGIDRSQGETDIASYSVLERHSGPQHHDTTLPRSRNCKSPESHLNNSNHLPLKEKESPKQCTDSNLTRQNACIGMKRSPALANLSLLLLDDEERQARECVSSTTGRTRSGSLSTTSSSDSNDQDFSFCNSWDNMFPPSIHDNDDDTSSSKVSSCCNYTTTQTNSEWGQYVDMNDFPKKRRKHF